MLYKAAHKAPLWAALYNSMLELKSKKKFSSEEAETIWNYLKLLKWNFKKKQNKTEVMFCG